MITTQSQNEHACEARQGESPVPELGGGVFDSVREVLFTRAPTPEMLTYTVTHTTPLRPTASPPRQAATLPTNHPNRARARDSCAEAGAVTQLRQQFGASLH